ncbi:hypothetical protein C8R46DRAFT_836753, partial [Mycena filopes]
HIPRPANMFMCFRSAYVKAQAAARSRPESVNQTAMSCTAAAAWANMSLAERQPFVIMAQAAKEAHALKYPNYRYAP